MYADFTAKVLLCIIYSNCPMVTQDVLILYDLDVLDSDDC